MFLVNRVLIIIIDNIIHGTIILAKKNILRNCFRTRVNMYVKRYICNDDEGMGGVE